MRYVITKLIDGSQYYWDSTKWVQVYAYVFQSEEHLKSPVALKGLAEGGTVEPLILGVRPEVARFAANMERRLAEHDEDRGDEWRTFGVNKLMERLGEETAEFVVAVAVRPEAAADEAADVANFAMFLVETLEKEGSA